MQDGSKTGLRAVRQNVPTSWKCRYGTKDTKNAGRFQNRTAGNLAKRSDLLKAPLRHQRYEKCRTVPKPDRGQSGKTFRPPESAVAAPKIRTSRMGPKPNRLRGEKRFRLL